MKKKTNKRKTKKRKTKKQQANHSRMFEIHGIAPAMPSPFSPKEQRELGPFYW